MNKLLVQLVLVVSSVVLVSGCTSGGSEIVEEEKDIIYDPLPEGSPVFAEVVEPYFNASSTIENAISLFSYKSPETVDDLATEDEPDKAKTEIISADDNIIISLNTEADSLGKDEYTLLAKNDSIYVVNHASNEIRQLIHFTTTVCEIIPRQKVIDDFNTLSGERELTVVHDDTVYVMTAESGEENDVCISDRKKRFYELPLDYQSEVSLNEGADISSLTLVTESLARSKLIFGWVDDADNAGQQLIDYAFLGYNSERASLSLFNKDKVEVWKQPRELQEFDVVDIGQGQTSSKYVFDVRPLENQFYQIQLGRDVFVVDSGLELLAKAQIESETILTDKVATLTATLEGENSYVLPAVSQHDAENLFIIDHAKIYQLAYQANAPVRNPTQPTRIINPQPSFDGKNSLGSSFKSQYFSQFDLKKCAANDAACIEAHNISSQEWQFFTPCEPEYGCVVANEVNDFCETKEEKLQTQSDEPLCTPTDYRHIAELNTSINDAQLLAYMQYAEKYTRHIDFILHNTRLYVTAKMDHRDVLINYDFNMDFSQPKALRENVLIGKRANLVGMAAYIANNNLYLTALAEGSIRSNECYKNSQKVTCNLSDLLTIGSSDSCTGSDLSQGLCVNQFKEYESKAFFCSENRLNNLTCSDNDLIQLNDLAVEIEDTNINEDAKWLKLYDYKDTSQKMYLLVGDHTLALDTGNLDEGKLYNPSLYEVDQINGDRMGLVTVMAGAVESLSKAWISKDPEQAVPEIFGHINLISQEVLQTGGAETINKSQLSTYLLEQTFDDSNALIPDTIKAPKVAERLVTLD